MANEKKRELGGDGGKPALKVSLMRSLMDDTGRRVLAFLIVFCFLCMLLALGLNLLRTQTRGSFIDVTSVKQNSDRIFVPTGFLLVIIGLLFFSLGGSYGDYTEVSIGKKSLHAKSFFRRLSFYFALIGAAFLLSSSIVDSIVR